MIVEQPRLHRVIKHTFWVLPCDCFTVLYSVFLADPGEARGCSTITALLKQYLRNKVKQIYHCLNMAQRFSYVNLSPAKCIISGCINMSTKYLENATLGRSLAIQMSVLERLDKIFF